MNECYSAERYVDGDASPTASLRQSRHSHHLGRCRRHITHRIRPPNPTRIPPPQKESRLRRATHEEASRVNAPEHSLLRLVLVRELAEFDDAVSSAGEDRGRAESAVVGVDRVDRVRDSAR